jgi:hypothetical protein
MRTDKFEDKIRKKLLSIEPEFSENDWENFQNYSAKNYVKPSGIFNQKMFKIVASIGIIGAVFIGLAQYYSQKNLLEKINILTTQNEKLQAKQTELENVIKNKAEMFNNKADLYGKSQATELENQKQLLNKTINNIEHQNANIERVQKMPNGKYLTQYNLSKSKYLLAITSEKKLQTSGYDKSQSHTIDKIDKYSSENNFIFSTNTDGEISHNNLTFNTLENRKIQLDTTKKGLKQLKKSDFLYYKLPQKSKKLYFTLADAYLRAGLNGSIGKNINSAGFIAELFLDQRLSVSAGANYKKMHFPAYFGERDFNNNSKKPFRDKYNLHDKQIKSVIKIKQLSNIFSIPMHFNYNHPLPNDIKIIASVGTEIDLKTSKKIEFNFERLPFVGPIYNNPQLSALADETIKEDTKTTPFNNIIIGTGIEKRFKNLGIQAKVFDQIAIKETNYRTKNSLGFEIGLNYKL